MFTHFMARGRARALALISLGLLLLLVEQATACASAAPTAIVTAPLGSVLVADTPAAPSPSPRTSDEQHYYLPSLLQAIPDTETYLADLAHPPSAQANAPALQGGAFETASPEARSQPGAKIAATLPVTPSLISGGDICAGVVQRDGEQLTLDGEPFTFVGTSVSYLLEDYFPETEIPQVLAYLADSGATAVRIWLFPNHDLDRAERVLDLGRQYGLRFVVSLVNYYYDKGGWWFDPQYYEKEYLPHVRDVVTRFRGRPEILMWELMNEPNCSSPEDGNCPKNMVRWATAVSKEIKKIDPCHLITTGAIRIDSKPDLYRDLHAIPTIDVVSIHKNADLWLKEEVEIAHEVGKPVLIGEVYARAYGKSCDLLHVGILEERAKVVAADMQRAWAEGVDGYLLWQYGHGRVEIGNDVQYYCDGYDYLVDDPVWELLASAAVPRVSIGPN